MKRNQKWLKYASLFVLLACGQVETDQRTDETQDSDRDLRRSNPSQDNPNGNSDDELPGSSLNDPLHSETTDPILVVPSPPPSQGTSNGSPGPGQGQGQGEGEGEGEGEGNGQGQGGGQGQGQGQGQGPGPGEAETPEQFEGVWVFYHYCLFAESVIESEKIKPLFPDEEYFEAWLEDIQKTVAAIRVRLRTPINPEETDVTVSCGEAYEVFKSKRTFSLAPDPANNEDFDIANIEPISGLPRLEDLVLSQNEIINMKYLRNLGSLRYLNLANNKIEAVPPLINPRTQVGLTNLKQLGLEFQGEAESNIDITQIASLRRAGMIKVFKINGNLVEPTPLRGMPQDFVITNPNRLTFVAGQINCFQSVAGMRYPTMIEGERRKKCIN